MSSTASVSSNSPTVSICGREFDKSALLITALGIAVLAIAAALWISYVQSNNSMQTRIDEINLEIKQLTKEIDQLWASSGRDFDHLMELVGRKNALWASLGDWTYTCEALQAFPPPTPPYVATAILTSLMGSTLVGCGIKGLHSNSHTVSLCGKEFDKSALVMAAIGVAVLAIAAILWMTYVQNNNSTIQMQAQVNELDLKLKQINQEIGQQLSSDRTDWGRLDQLYVEKHSLSPQLTLLRRAWDAMRLSPPPQDLYVTGAILTSMIGSILVGYGVKQLQQRGGL